jgi:glycine cleavage system pyridoxal-binding protein P
MAVTAAIQLGWLGTFGLAEVATRCAQGAHYLASEVKGIDGVAVLDQPFFREFTLFTKRRASDVVSSLVDEGFLGEWRCRRSLGRVICPWRVRYENTRWSSRSPSDAPDERSMIS